MIGQRGMIIMASAALALWLTAAPVSAGAGDANDDGFIDLSDYAAAMECLSTSGPGVPYTNDMCAAHDTDEDGDVDLKDVSPIVALGIGHLPIVLKDHDGNPITEGQGPPYSPRQTCGGCHEFDGPDGIANGTHFQQGRTAVDGTVITGDDYFEDGRTWERGPGRYGRFTPGTGGVTQLAPKTADNESQIDRTTFAWVADCGGCHPGGGPSEFDRDGHKLYDHGTGQFGYEAEGLTAGDVTLDGDYALMNLDDGTLGPAPWNETGVAEPDCLICHRGNRKIFNEVDMHQEWRKAVLAAGTSLVDLEGSPVPAFKAAATVSQGWFSQFEYEQDPPVISLCYCSGAFDQSLLTLEDGSYALAAGTLVRTPYDTACWSCHGEGCHDDAIRTWFDERDVHYAAFNNLNDEDETNDIPPHESQTCVHCHTGNLAHNIAKGRSMQMHFRDELDYVGFRTCRSCHLTEIAPGILNPDKDPDAPDVPGGGIVHNSGPMFDRLACQTCHLRAPFAPSLAFVDYAASRTGVFGRTEHYYSIDPLDPTNLDKSSWSFNYRDKMDIDDEVRYFPCIAWPGMYWADWDQNGTPADMSDDVLTPIITWRIVQVLGPDPLPIVTDDDSDGVVELNRLAEIDAYIQAIKAGNDDYGRPLASNPVLVKADKVYYEDAGSVDNVSLFDYTQTTLAVPVTRHSYVYEADHNVPAAAQAFGGGFPPACFECHTGPEELSPLFDRHIMLDPYDTAGLPVYDTPRNMIGMGPP